MIICKTRMITKKALIVKTQGLVDIKLLKKVAGSFLWGVSATSLKVFISVQVTLFTVFIFLTGLSICLNDLDNSLDGVLIFLSAFRLISLWWARSLVSIVSVSIELIARSAEILSVSTEVIFISKLDDVHADWSVIWNSNVVNVSLEFSCCGVLFSSELFRTFSGPESILGKVLFSVKGPCVNPMPQDLTKRRSPSRYNRSNAFTSNFRSFVRFSEKTVDIERFSNFLGLKAFVYY